MKSDCFVSVVLPLKKDSRKTNSFLGKLSPILTERYVDHEIVLIDTSGKETPKIDELLKTFRCVRYLRLSRELDIEIAITAGLDTVIGDYVVIMCPESDPVELVPEIISLCQSGHDVAYGVRKPDGRDFFLTRFCRCGFSWICHRFLHIEWIHRAMHFRCLSRQMVNSMVQIQDNHRCIRTSSLSIAGSPKAVYYSPLNRESKDTNRSFFQNMRYALSVISQNSFHPLRMATWLGLVAVSSNFIYMLYILAVWALKENIAEGWVSSTLPIVAHFLLFSIILTIFSEYLGTVLTRLQHRPLYSIADEKNSSVKFVSEDMRNVVNRSFLDSN
ncbi:Uncharacterized protein SCG7086_BJ_00100 [Chlamydiales bacterium SCGC AG-110-P3]|nr:Uncharacterized protein SCG7086_BJ_00100 [Chlamydiales bacterium SCGC AG-110-P3]